MRILFDHGTPAPLRSFLTGHTVWEAKAQSWDTYKNGDLLVAVDAATPGSFTEVDIPAA